MAKAVPDVALAHVVQTEQTGEGEWWKKSRTMRKDYGDEDAKAVGQKMKMKWGGYYHHRFGQRCPWRGGPAVVALGHYEYAHCQ